MDISRHLHNDHAELRSLGRDILGSMDDSGVGGRDNQFDLYDIQVRRHLAVVEEALLTPLKKDPDATDACADIKARHKELRRDLSSLDRADKGSHQWTAEFRNFTESFEAVCARHEALLNHAEHVSGRLGEDYNAAKLRRMKGHPWSWNRVAPSTGATAAAAVGAAALAGAAFAATRYFKSGRRASGRQQDDFELRLETDETLRLISSSKVEGTPVVDRDGSKIGTIDSFMVDKYTGRVAYAVMSFGGTFGSAFGGFGASLFPLPWPILDYDEKAGGYMLDIAKEDMKDAPRFEASSAPEFDAEYRRDIILFYRPLTAGSYASGSSPDSWNRSTAKSTSASAPSPMPSPEPTSVG